MSDGEKTFPLYSGQDNLIGTLYVKNDGTTIWVRYVLDEGCGGYLSSYHLQVDKSESDLIKAICNKSGSPMPGQCEMKGDSKGASSTDWILVTDKKGNVDNFNGLYR